MRNLLITGAVNFNEKQLNQIRQLGYNTTFAQDERIPLDIPVDDFDTVICNGLFLSNPIDNFKSLKRIQLTSAGYDRVPMEYISEKDIEIFNAGGVYSIPMAEFALCGVLSLYKSTRFFDKNKAEKKWEKNRNIKELYGKTVCILGAGNIGTEVAKRFKAFGTEVIGVDISKKENACFSKVVALDELDSVLHIADIVILTLPLTEKTNAFFDKSRLDAMKNDAVLVNISRGRIINESDLIKELTSGRLYGAVLDVFEQEPLDESSPLWNFDNVILTPHNSFVGEGNQQRLRDLIINNLRY